MQRAHLFALVLAACVKSASLQCGDELCPVGLACASGHCVDPNIVAACNGQADNDPCDLGEGGSGVCQGGLCIVGTCGDGVINGTEECDGTDLGSATCLDYGAPQPGGLVCGSDCKLDPSGCTAYCGNGHIDGNEQCDGSNFDNKSCEDYGYYSGTLSCTATCTVDLGGCMGICGDGMIEGFEECDGSNLNGKTCALLGYNGSVLPLTCGSNCAFTASSCTCGGMLCGSAQTCVTTGQISACQ